MEKNKGTIRIQVEAYSTYMLEVLSDISSGALIWISGEHHKSDQI